MHTHTSNRPMTIAILVVMQLAYLGMAVFLMITKSGINSLWDLVFSAGGISLLGLTAVGLWFGVRWAYLVEIGIFGALVVGWLIIAIDGGRFLGGFGVIAVGVLAYLFLSPKVRRFFGGESANATIT